MYIRIHEKWKVFSSFLLCPSDVLLWIMANRLQCLIVMIMMTNGYHFAIQSHRTRKFPRLEGGARFLKVCNVHWNNDRDCGLCLHYNVITKVASKIRRHVMGLWLLIFAVEDFFFQKRFTVNKNLDPILLASFWESHKIHYFNPNVLQYWVHPLGLQNLYSEFLGIYASTWSYILDQREI